MIQSSSTPVSIQVTVTPSHNQVSLIPIEPLPNNISERISYPRGSTPKIPNMLTIPMKADSNKKVIAYAFVSANASYFMSDVLDLDQFVKACDSTSQELTRTIMDLEAVRSRVGLEDVNQASTSTRNFQNSELESIDAVDMRAACLSYRNIVNDPSVSPERKMKALFESDNDHQDTIAKKS